jgi:F0F1-type ATP synthase assembly protein I
VAPEAVDLTPVKPAPPATAPEPPEKKSFLVQVAHYSQLAVVFPAATVIGWLIGLALDHWLHTTWLYLVGLLLGIAGGFIELIRTVSSSDFE